MIPYQSSLPETGGAEREPPADRKCPPRRKGLLAHIAAARAERLAQTAHKQEAEPRPAPNLERETLMNAAVFMGCVMMFLAWLTWDGMPKGGTLAIGMVWLFWTLIVWRINLWRARRRLDRERRHRVYAMMEAELLAKRSDSA